MSISVMGTFEGGRVLLDSIPEGISRARVKVEFEEPAALPGRKKFILRFGMLAEPGARMSTWEDFEEVKKQWNPEEM